MELVSAEEYIIRRVLPSSETMKYSTSKNPPSTRMRATSAALNLRQNEQGLSCSRLLITSPKELVEQVEASVSGAWQVCVWKVSDLPEGITVVITPSIPPGLDPGHCEIRSKNFSSGLKSKLAQASTILTQHQVETMKAGDIPDLS